MSKKLKKKILPCPPAYCTWYMRRPTLFVNLFLPKWFSCIQSVIHFQVKSKQPSNRNPFLLCLLPPFFPPPPLRLFSPLPSETLISFLLGSYYYRSQTQTRPSMIRRSGWVNYICVRIEPRNTTSSRNPRDQHLSRTNWVKNKFGNR